MITQNRNDIYKMLLERYIAIEGSDVQSTLYLDDNSVGKYEEMADKVMIYSPFRTDRFVSSDMKSDLLLPLLSNALTVSLTSPVIFIDTVNELIQAIYDLGIQVIRLDIGYNLEEPTEYTFNLTDGGEYFMQTDERSQMLKCIEDMILG